MTLEDLELPPRRERPSLAPSVSQLLGAEKAAVGAGGGGSQASQSGVTWHRRSIILVFL